MNIPTVKISIGTKTRGMINGVTATRSFTNWIMLNGGRPCNPVRPVKFNVNQ